MVRATICLIALMWATVATACVTQGKPMHSEAPGAPELRVVLPEIPIARPFTMELVLCGEKVNIITVEAIMPAHKHGMNYRPIVTDQGNGTFRVDGMVFHMPGTWELRIDGKKDGKIPLHYTYVIQL